MARESRLFQANDFDHPDWVREANKFKVKFPSKKERLSIKDNWQWMTSPDASRTIYTTMTERRAGLMVEQRQGINESQNPIWRWSALNLHMLTERPAIGNTGMLDMDCDLPGKYFPNPIIAQDWVQREVQRGLTWTLVRPIDYVEAYRNYGKEPGMYLALPNAGTMLVIASDPISTYVLFELDMNNLQPGMLLGKSNDSNYTSLEETVAAAHLFDRSLGPSNTDRYCQALDYSTTGLF